MKDMKSRTNVVNKLSLILRIVIFLHSLSLSHCYVWSDTDRETKPSLANRLPQPLPQSRPQFVSEAIPLTQSLSLSSLVKTTLTEAFRPPERRASSVQSNVSNGCSLILKYPFCSCYALDDGLLIDCKIAAIYQMTDVLNSLISQPIKSFSVYSINQTLNSLPERLFQNFSSIEQIYISLPSLVDVLAQTLVGLESSLKTLSIVNSKLTAVPKTALNRLNSLSALDLQSNVIREVESNAFQGLPLVSLNLQSNLIDSLHEFSFGGLENTLVELVLIDNRLDVFPLNAFQRLTTLEVLKLQSNRISEIPDNGLTRLTALKSLDLQSNRLKQLKSNWFKTTPNLVSLSLANNELSVLSDSLVFESLIDLENLDLSHNILQNVYLNNLIALRTVDLSNNLLEVIEFSNLDNLREVFLSNNKIVRLTDQTFINTSSLSVIFLQDNAIESIDYNTFHSLKELLTLDLSSNQLRAIDPLLLRHNTHLQSLYLDNNLISYIGLEVPNASNQELNKSQRSYNNNSVCLMDCYAFDGLNELQVIDLSHNTIRTIPSRLFQSVSSLETLHLDSNWLSSIPNSLLRNSLHNLKTLTFNANPIVRIREDETSSYGFPGLEILTINDANITTIASHDFLGFPNLKILSLKNNGIQRLNPSALRPLQRLCELDLSANKLDIVAEERLSGLVELKLLNVSNNNLSELPHFSPHLKALQTLDISYNRVTRIHSFGYLAQSMAYISVRHNMIAWIANNAFHNMTSLKTIDLRQNFLTQLSSQIFDTIQHNLQSILLSGNPFHCDCRLLSIYEWLESHSRLLALSDREDIICAQPEKLKDNSILSLHPVDFCPVPLISIIEISKLESTQVRIRWEVQNDTLVGGFTLEYYLTANRTPPLTQKILGPTDRQSDITDLRPDNWYTICVEANGKYLRSESINPMPYVIDHNKNFAEYVTTNRKCSQVRTLSHSDRSLIPLSTLGIIVGVVVFVLLILTFSVIWVVYKIRAKRRRRPPKKEDVPEEYITYRHFSLY